MSSSSSGSMIPWDVNSYDGKLMFAAIISLLLVLSFVLLLHAYARWVFLLDQSALHRRRTALSSRDGTTTATRLRHHLRIVDESGVEFENEDDNMGGVDDSVIASIPVFVHKTGDDEISRLECVICLSVFEDGEIGRHLPNCNHAFHVKCIDRWLGSHSSCPICRALVEWKKTMDVKSVLRDETESVLEEVADQENTQPPPLPLPSPPPLPSPAPLQFLMGCSLKRILSLSRSEKVFPSSSNVNDLNV
ncbi:RING-type E3 ubiquitin transferase [Ranunculus cassubicifolius]